MIRNLALGIAVLAVAVLVFLAFDTAGPGFSTSALTKLVAPPAAATPVPGEVIPLQSIANINSLEGTVKLNVNGLIDGERTKGELNGALTMSDPKTSRVTVSGSLLGPLVTKVGGSLVGLFTPSKVDLYKMPDGTYIVVNGLLPICVKPKALNATESLDEMSPQSLVTMLTSSDVARGTLVGQETLNGVPVKHYVIDGDAFLAAAQDSENEDLKSFAEGLWSAEDAHIYLDAKTGYPVAFRGQFSGEYEPLKFEGDFGIEIDLTNINGKTAAVSLPSACNKPISQ
jgi:hypothetical protein